MADCENIVSNKVLNKIGLSFIEKFNLDGIEHYWLRLKKRAQHQSIKESAIQIKLNVIVALRD